MIISSQPFNHYLVISSGAKIFTTEDKFFKPHVQEGNVFPLTHDSFFLVLSNIARPSTYALGFQLMREFVITMAEKGIWGEDI
jgi:hypothetical protein